MAGDSSRHRGKVFHLKKVTNDAGKLRITMTGIKHEGISTFSWFIKKVDSLKS